MNILIFFIGLTVGVLLTYLFIKSYAPFLIVNESRSKYDFDETIEKLESSVGEKGWRMPHVHNMQEIMKKNGFTVKKTKVLEICKPEYAYEILTSTDGKKASSFLPCRIAVYEKEDGSVIVSRLRGKEVGSLFGGIVSKMMAKAGNESENIINCVTV